MTDARDLEAKFWKALKSDRTIMLGLAGIDDGIGQPMTALVEEDGDRHTVWVFTDRETDFARALGQRSRAVASFSSKGHDLFAAIEGELFVDMDREAIDRLWSPFVAAWYEGGKADPGLLLLRFELEHAQIWLNENSLFAGMKMLLGRDPKREFKDKVGEVRPN
jgi:general stress protein 26